MKNLDFNLLDDSEKDFYLNDTWCDSCQKADLGIYEPKYFELHNKKVVEGKCKVCHSICRSEIYIRVS